MKKLLIIVCAVALFTNCNNNGKKNGGLFGGGGDWSDSDEKKFMNTCLQNAMNAGADRQTSTDHCQCTLKKIQKKFSSYAEADRNMTKEEVTAIEQECIAGNNNEGNDNRNGGLFGGGGDKWSNADEQKFMNTCVQNATNGGADRQTANAHCQCTLKKIQKKYNSYAEADRNMTTQDVNAIEQECIQENNNGGGDRDNN